MNRRFYSENTIDGDSATLADSEAHHLMHVLRAVVGDRVILFDGSGTEFQAEVESMTRRDVALKILERNEVDREASRVVTLAVALPKGDRQKWLVEKCVELGVHTIVPLQTARSVALPKASAMQKLNRAVIEASKQCGRNRLMQIAAPQSFDDLIRSLPEGVLGIIAHPYDAVDLRDLQQVSEPQEAQPLMAAVGPEGGFSEDEVAAALAADWQSVALGPRILRIETAAIAVAARLIQHS